MAVTFPLALPTTKCMASIQISAHSIVGMTRSLFSGAMQTYDWGGSWWEAMVTLPPMSRREDAEEWVAFLTSLNGLEGSFLLGEPVNKTPRGSWGGTPVVMGAHAARAKTIAIDGLDPGQTTALRKGDWVQFGSAGASRLHKSSTDAASNGSGVASIEIWPPLRAALADNAAIVTASPKGLFMLADNRREWTISTAQFYGIQFACMEDLRDI